MTGPEDSIRPEDRILWEPSPERVASSVLAEFASRHGPYSGQTSFDYDGLHRWSIDQPAAFWESMSESPRKSANRMISSRW